MLIVLTN